MKILIDARLYGIENAGLGRYIINLVSELSKQDFQNQYVLLLRKKYFDSLELPSNWVKVLSDFHHYSFTEQIKLPFIINSIKPDICHFPHFNVPIFYKGRFVVTIHDMLMHNQKGFDASTLSHFNYIIKRLGYKFVFKKAIENSCKIIVPSNSVKNEVLEYFKIKPNKVEVIYEG